MPCYSANPLVTPCPGVGQWAVPITCIPRRAASADGVWPELRRRSTIGVLLKLAGEHRSPARNAELASLIVPPAELRQIP